MISKLVYLKLYGPLRKIKLFDLTFNEDLKNIKSKKVELLEQIVERWFLGVAGQWKWGGVGQTLQTFSYK